ncbi:GPI ethanolamine phosphate transferase 2 isoform X2 [Andrographis paniculata]|nr:GPI ethanolamine phosphate transferase 2 isoform X2 [Andrographis paniculata]
MVVDGLPAELVLGKNGKPPAKTFRAAMPYTQSLLAEGLAIGYHAKAAPPTVTMPRLKAMVSGAIGGFLDVAFNFNTQAFLDDNLVAQFFKIGWKMVMLGDETWLKLFPDMFARHDGVSSFFVKDTIQVDFNVSRHLEMELSNTDWDLLILHYLGLDHVGHIGGRNSILMGPKLMEMDEVIRRIHSTITNEVDQRTLLMVVSDHGMTEGGNHGGSSYEETDSLALFVSAEKFADCRNSEEAYQVDITPTLSLLFGVPIPKNNIGMVMSEVFSSLEDGQLLRILELNSWQLLLLLRTQLDEFECGRSSCEPGSGARKSDGGAEIFCCLYLDAATVHESWKSKNSSRSSDGDHFKSTVSAYQNFLRPASQWLSSRSTNKPIAMLLFGIVAMFVSCLGLIYLLSFLAQEVHLMESRHLSHNNNSTMQWHMEDIFCVAVIIILVLSMASTSMIEEEQYIWHFMTSSLYFILLRKTICSIANGGALNSTVEQTDRRSRYVYLIVAVLISGRVLRGWHQGGVNWTYLPDISKLLEQAGPTLTKSLQVLSIILVFVFCVAALLTLHFKRKAVVLLALFYLFPTLMILRWTMKFHDNTLTSLSIGSTTMIQIIYALIGSSTVGILVATPWLMPFRNLEASLVDFNLSSDLLCGFRDSLYLIGWSCVFSWCLLQMLLQQPINSIPGCLILVEILASICCFSDGDDYLCIKQWVKVAALYYLGMAGHYGLGNTNTLATIDVAGAFMGVSSHSTIISGILMFMITYASPMLALVSMLMNISRRDILSNPQDSINNYGRVMKSTLGYPCLVLLILNSIILLAYAIMLLIMRNHLFIWSVFSPKYLYVCATTVCVYVGVLLIALCGTYTCVVFTIRTRLAAACWFNKTTPTPTAIQG